MSTDYAFLAAVTAGGNCLAANHSLFEIYNGVFAVGREKHIGQSLFFGIISDIARAVFLIRAENKTHVLTDRKSQLLYGAKSKKRCHGRTLVIYGTSAEELAVLFYEGEGIALPAVARGDNIEMAKHSECRLAALGKVSCAYIIFVIFCMEAVFLTVVKHLCKSLCRLCAERHSRLRLAFDARHGNEICKHSLHLLCMRIDIFVYSAFDIVHKYLSIRPSGRLCACPYFLFIIPLRSRRD